MAGISLTTHLNLEKLGDSITLLHRMLVEERVEIPEPVLPKLMRTQQEWDAYEQSLEMYEADVRMQADIHITNQIMLSEAIGNILCIPRCVWFVTKAGVICVDNWGWIYVVSTDYPDLDGLPDPNLFHRELGVETLNKMGWEILVKTKLAEGYVSFSKYRELYESMPEEEFNRRNMEDY